jgi:hypothetical protein
MDLYVDLKIEHSATTLQLEILPTITKAVNYASYAIKDLSLFVVKDCESWEFIDSQTNLCKSITDVYDGKI